MLEFRNLMKITLVTVGKPKLVFAQEGLAEYHKRLGRFVECELIHIKDGKDVDEKIIKTIGHDFCVILDEKGRSMSSRELADFLEIKKNSSQNVSFVIGGPDGHSQKIKDRADFTWSLSSLTFPHDIAMMITLETLYRSFSILENHPYHRD